MRKSTERESYHHGDLAAALVAAALKLIAQHGVEGFSIRQAAVLVGVAPSAAYRHFTDRADLLAAVASQGFAQLAKEMVEAATAARNRHRSDEKKAIAAFEAQGLSYVTFAVNNPEQFVAMFGRYGASSLRPDLNTCTTAQSPYDLLISSLDALVSAKVVTPKARRNAELLAWSTVHGLANIFISYALADQSNSDIKRDTLETIRRLLHGLQAE